MFFQLMVTIPLAMSFVPREEVDLDLYGTDLTDEDRLLMLIEDLGPAVAAEFAAAKRPGAYGKVRPRNGLLWPWRVRKLRLWRLDGLQQPLWLGADGVIYRGYGPMAEYFDRPDYWMRAEIEKRDLGGLERVLIALTEAHGPATPPIHVRGAEL